MKNAGILLVMFVLQFSQITLYAQTDSGWYKKAIFYQIYPPLSKTLMEMGYCRACSNRV
jgi:hypothetical protein